MGTRVNVTYQPGECAQEFGLFTLSYVNPEGMEMLRPIRFDMQQLWAFAHDTNSVSFDVLILALIVYNTDKVLNRYLYSEDGWRRHIQITNLPVRNRRLMQSAKEKLDRSISFLTGDDWDINYANAPEYQYNPIGLPSYEASQYKKVALFSGGLDSLIGFVDEASRLGKDEKILLVSHMDLGKESADQNGILNICVANGYFNEQYTRLLLTAGLYRNDTGIKVPSETTLRSRSLLFFAAGIYLANHINPNMKLIVPENGTISLNVPLDEGRRSACSTRTTHPTFIRRFQDALTAVGILNKLENPYRFKSKADMMSDCCEDDTRKVILRQLYKESCSCAKRGHNRFWDRRGQLPSGESISHCGMCLPCLYRRVALHAVGWDEECYLGTDVLHGINYDWRDKSKRRTWDFNALLNFISLRMNEDTIRTELIANGIRDKRDLDEYTELAMHSYEQVKEWIAAKAPSEIKHRIGL